MKEGTIYSTTCYLANMICLIYNINNVERWYQNIGCFYSELDYCDKKVMHIQRWAKSSNVDNFKIKINSPK